MDPPPPPSQSTAPQTTSRQKATIFIGGLDTSITQSALYDAFLPFGDIVDVSLASKNPANPSNAPNGSSAPGGTGASQQQHRGFGYVEFESSLDAAEAIDNMDRAELGGAVIKVALARPMKEVGEGLGSRTAVWEQEGWIAKHAVSEEDRLAAQQGTSQAAADDGPMDPMQGLEGLDEAGPKLASSFV
ncbi:RNA-binding domain-containing protein [Periconia macrospinosa]|uniref:RNA-binding domain-containing protein n=1 Tax=Periconia macrospinosa TaxID=97972 RepID=A0A2V1DJ32_9PLEO|nr:RNA-binding domain-containing protein [Periconia macrospinosa]